MLRTTDSIANCRAKGNDYEEEAKEKAKAKSEPVWGDYRRSDSSTGEESDCRPRPCKLWSSRWSLSSSPATINAWAPPLLLNSPEILSLSRFHFLSQKSLSLELQRNAREINRWRLTCGIRKKTASFWLEFGKSEIGKKKMELCLTMSTWCWWREKKGSSGWFLLLCE